MRAQALINTAEAILASMREKGLIDESRTGGYMTVLCAGRDLEVSFLTAQVGELTDPVKIKKTYRFSREKARRLLLNTLATWDVSSWQSRNPKKSKWGGAIRAGDFILSFSGLPELADEALMLAVALKLEMLTREQADRIADISGNEILRQLYDI